MSCINTRITKENGFINPFNKTEKYIDIPLFYHVPKNAGTYFISIIILFLRLFRRERTDWLKLEHETIKNIEIFEKNKSIGRVIVADPHNTIGSKFKTKDVNKVYYPLRLNKINEGILENIFIFALIIEPDGFIYQQKVIDLFSFEKFNFEKCIILRPPFERARSFYNYIVDDMSEHEWTHGLITGDNFEEYLKSGYVEDSWVIRNLCGIGDTVPIEEYHLDKANSLLINFKAVDIKETNSLLNLIFRRCYKYEMDQIPKEWSVNITRNSSSKKDMIEFSDLDESAQKAFINRTQFDEQLYRHNVLCR